jgi:outer membrane protein OmpA-like peptidoglycan-associated protein
MPTVRPRFSAVLLAVVLLGACSGSSGKPSAGGVAGGDEPATTEATTVVEGEPTTTLPPGAVAGLEDFDGDGQPDPTCGTQDFGAGLVLRIPCTIISANDPEQGTRLVPKSLFRLPGSTDVDLTGMSGSLVLARDAAGARVVIVVFNTDNLFQTGSATIGSTETLDGTIRLINARYPRSAIQVRGHTDATGTAAANQTLSERRASTVKDYLTSHGVQASEVTSVGLGSSQPLTEEHNPDGSDSPAGRRFNRRVEIVLRPR